MRLIFLFVTVTVFLSTIAQRLGITAKSNDTQPFSAESSEGNSSDIISLLHCNVTNTTEYIASQDCLCVAEPASTQLGSSTTDEANETRSWRCAPSCPRCDGSTEPCRNCLCDSDEACHCVLVNSNADCVKDPELEKLTSLADFKYPVNVLVLVPMPDAVHKPAFDQGGAIIPAVQLAAEQINQRNDILPTLRINVRVRDSGCDKVSKTVLEIVTILRELLQPRNGVVGIVGPACSEESVFVNTFFNRRSFDEPIPVFYSGTSPYLSENAQETPNAFGMISSATVLIDALIGIAHKEEWNWENIAVFYDGAREFFQHIYSTFIRRLNNSQQIGYTRQISDSQIPLKGIIDTDIRIVIVFSGKKPARQLTCLAGQSDIEFVFPIRQFIFPERTLENFLGDENAEPSFIELTERKRYHCDKETVMRGLNGSVLLNQALDSVDPDMVTVSNYTAGQVKEQYKERLSQYNKAQNSTFLESIYAYPYYDAMWAFAYGWNVVHLMQQTMPFATMSVFKESLTGLSSELAETSRFLIPLESAKLMGQM